MPEALVVDAAWIAVVGAIVGGGLTGVVTLLQARMQRTFDLSKSAAERHHVDRAKRREELVEVYTRYQLAADRLENAIRELTGCGASHFEAAQAEYDVACQLLNLLAPRATADAAMRQRRLFNRLALQGLEGTYNHQASIGLITEAATPVLDAMRSDLGSRD